MEEMKDEMDFFYLPRNVQLRVKKEGDKYLAEVYRHTMNQTANEMKTDIVGSGSDKNKFTALGKALYETKRYLDNGQSA